MPARLRSENFPCSSNNAASSSKSIACRASRFHDRGQFLPPTSRCTREANDRSGSSSKPRLPPPLAGNKSAVNIPHPGCPSASHPALSPTGCAPLRNSKPPQPRRPVLRRFQKPLRLDARLRINNRDRIIYPLCPQKKPRQRRRHLLQHWRQRPRLGRERARNPRSSSRCNPSLHHTMQPRSPSQQQMPQPPPRMVVLIFGYRPFVSIGFPA